MRPRPNSQVLFSRSLLAAFLWDHGEDELADIALAMSDADLRHVQAIAAHFEDPDYPLPVTGQRISHGHVMALAAIAYFEKDVRALAQVRRRPQRSRPERFTPR